MEQGASSFGDNRLDRANRFIQDRLASHGPDGLSVRRLGGNRAGEVRIGRFLRNGIGPLFNRNCGVFFERY